MFHYTQSGVCPVGLAQCIGSTMTLKVGVCPVGLAQCIGGSITLKVGYVLLV